MDRLNFSKFRLFNWKGWRIFKLFKKSERKKYLEHTCNSVTAQEEYGKEGGCSGEILGVQRVCFCKYMWSTFIFLARQDQGVRQLMVQSTKCLVIRKTLI